MQQETLAELQDKIAQPEALLSQVIAYLIPLSLNALAALFIFVVGMFIAGRLRRYIRHLITKSKHIDTMLAGFLSSFAYYAMVAMVILMVLGQFGVETTSLAAIMGAMGLAIGLALQGTLSHIASGMMIIAFRPFNIGDYIIAGGEEGTVKDITLVTTELATPDNKKIIVPNGKVWDDTITNYSANQTRRLDLTYSISYHDDINKARHAIASLVKEDNRVFADPEPIIEVHTLNDYSVDFTVRLWLKGSDYFPVRWALNQTVKEAFDAQGITIPFPTRLEIQSSA
ncbi:MAG: mechanosensitive ion channel family protein [bacterium]